MLLSEAANAQGTGFTIFECLLPGLLFDVIQSLEEPKGLLWCAAWFRPGLLRLNKPPS
jgi:hypothetical protein